jgi:hypothetical protein
MRNKSPEVVALELASDVAEALGLSDHPNRVEMEVRLAHDLLRDEPDPDDGVEHAERWDGLS